MTGWRPALLIAWREALRHRGRSLLVLVMIALPVLGVTAAAVVLETSRVTGAEGADRAMGAADALVWSEGDGRVLQAPDPQDQGYTYTGVVGEGRTSEAELRAVLGEDIRLLPLVEGWSGARLGERVVGFEYTGVDLRDPLAAPLFDVTTGRLPEAPDEVVANDALLDKGFSVGDRVDLPSGAVTIVGSGRDATLRDQPVLVGFPAAFDSGDAVSRWLVEAGEVTWAEVQQLNAVGAVVSSRAVLADPPDVAALAEQMGYDTGQDEMMAVAALIVVMALLEVVLLAGPAFAVGARRQARALALVSASGGTPAQARRVVLAAGLVLGGVASAAGVVLGVALGWALLPVAQRFDRSWFGPFEVPYPWLAAIAGFGLLSSFLAAVVPAVVASRQDVVAVLAGRRGDRAPRAATPVLGLVLLAAGIGGSSYGALDADSGSSGAVWIAASAVVSVLGMILVVPVVVTTVARFAGRMPLTTRYAVRDAARHRTRTVPAVAAVAATVAGVVALGIANASHEKENEQTYASELAMGMGRVSWWPTVLPGEQNADAAPVWQRLEEVVHDTAPDVRVTEVRGMPEGAPDGSYQMWQFRPPGETDEPLLSSYGGGFATSVLVADSAEMSGLPDQQTRDEVDDALASGRAVVFTSRPVEATEVVVEVVAHDPEGSITSGPTSRTLPATYVEMRDGTAPVQALLPPQVADDFGTEPATFGLLLEGDLDERTETRLAEALGGAVQDAGLYVERGYQRPDDAVVLLLILGVLGGVLMLGGTLTATFLALSDARPDMATLSAVGASPRTRRGVAASYALVVGFVGALLGAGVGFIPGVAISRPLTSIGEGGPYLAVPWLLILTLVVALPLLTAAVVGVAARARLPLVARLD